MKLGLVLCGGSLRGVYGHIAVAQTLRELNLTPDVILGASAGSVVGSFMASNMPNAEMCKRMNILRAADILDPLSRLEMLKALIIYRGKTLRGFVKGDRLDAYMQGALGDKNNFSKLDIPLYVAATDLKTYKLTLFNTGSVSEKIRASAAIPLLFCPQQIDGKFYIDGAIHKGDLPKALLNVCPDLDYVIVSNFSYERETDDNSFIDQATFPLVEIANRALAMHDNTSWPKKIGKTKMMYLAPGLTQPVDLFNPSRAIAQSVYSDSKAYSKYHLTRYFNRVLRRKDSQDAASA